MKRILFAILLGTFFISCENKKEQIDAITRKEYLPGESARNIEITYSDSGRVKAKIVAGELQRMGGEKPQIEFTKGVQIWMYDSLKRPESEMSSGYAIHYENEKLVEAKKNVIVINQNGEKLNTEHLIWNQGTGMIYTKEFVKITTGDEVIIGEGLEADQYFRKYKIKNIKGTFNLKTD